MRVTFRNLLSVIVIFILFVLVLANVIIKKYASYQLELIGSKVVEGDFQIGSINFNYYPLYLTLHNVKLRKYNEVDPLKGMEIKRITANFDEKSIFSDVLLIKYIKVTEPTVIYDAGELGIKDFGKKAIKDVAVGAAGQALLGPIALGLGVAKKGVDVVKGIKEKSKAKKEEDAKLKAAKEELAKSRPFIIQNVFINDMKFIPADDVLWLKKGDHVDVPKIEMSTVDNATVFDLADQIKMAVVDAVKVKLGVKTKKDKNNEVKKKESIKKKDDAKDKKDVKVDKQLENKEKEGNK